QSCGEIGWRGECRLTLAEASGQALRDLLEQPDIPVLIIESCQRTVAGTVRVRTRDAPLGAAVKYLAHLDAAQNELGARSFDVVHDKKVGQRRAGAEVDRGRRTWRRELDSPGPVRPDEIGIEPPTQIFVEALGAVDVGNGDDGDFELHIDFARF